MVNKEDVEAKDIDKKNEPDKKEFEEWKRNKEKSRQEQMDLSLSKIKEYETLLQQKVDTNGKTKKGEERREKSEEKKEEPDIYGSWLSE